VNNPTPNTNPVVDSNKPVMSSPSPMGSSSPAGKKSISEVIARIHKEIKNTSESVISLVGEIKDVKNSLSNIDARVNELEGGSKKVGDKIGEMDDNMGKFLSLYELVNNQYNPFVEKEEPFARREIVLDSTGSSIPEKSASQDEIKEKFKEIDMNKQSSRILVEGDEEDDIGNSLLELDTLNIEEAAAEAVPLTRLKGSTNSLVTILSWLEYLVKKVGIEETKNTLRYYTETLKWITPEVYFELDKFLKGMSDIVCDVPKRLNVRDHIVSLYFISKLNEKTLDKKLTKAVLQIIKE